MSLAILFHFLYAQHVLDINISIIRSLRLCCWITTLVVLFCKDGWFSISVNLQCLVACAWCDVFCRFVVVGGCILIDFDCYLLCFVIIVLVCVWYINKALITKHPMRNTTRARIAGFSLQYEHHSKPAAPNLQHTMNWEQDDWCGNSSKQSQVPDDGYINVRNMLNT